MTLFDQACPSRASKITKKNSQKTESVFPEYPSKQALSRRERRIVAPLFLWRLSLAGTFLGEDSVLRRRMGFDHDLRNGTLPPREKRETRGVTEPTALICDQGLFWASSPAWEKSSHLY